MGSIDKLADETLVAIFRIVQRDELRAFKKIRDHGKHRGVVLSQTLLSLRLVCARFRSCVDSAGIEAVMTRTRNMASMFGRVEAKMQFLGGSVRPFGLPKMSYTYVSNHTACMEALWTNAGRPCLGLFREICVHQRFYVCASFLMNYADLFLARRVTAAVVETTPRGFVYPFDGKIFRPAEGAPPSHGDISGTIRHVSLAIDQAGRRSGVEALWSGHMRLKIRSLLFLLGRTRTWSVNSTRQDFFPSHILRAKQYILSEGPHSKKDSPCFIRGKFVLVPPSIQLGPNFVAVSSVGEVHLSYIDLGCAATFLAYFSGLRKVVLGERVLNRNGLERSLRRLKPELEIWHNFRHV